MESSTTTNKNRTPSRCREWERNRRNKFNEAIARLGELVKKINKATDVPSKDSDNVQFPKIEIIEKAIICLSNFAQEKTQLKSEVLALQVKIEAVNNKNNKKDVSTQVFIGLNRKKKDGKYVKVLMLKKPKINVLKEKTMTTNVSIEPKINNLKTVIKVSSPNKSTQKLPTLLPRTNLNDKKGPENTIVVLPAAPYIIPQRPLLFPTVPPAFVLVDSNLQALSKSSFPLVNRNNGDVTKTTMVNILPISAYSRPLSATKTKKNGRSKVDVAKKTTKKSKQVVKVAKELNANNKIVNGKDNEMVKEKETDNDNMEGSLKSKKDESLTVVTEVNFVKKDNTATKIPISGTNTTLRDNFTVDTQESGKINTQEKINHKKVVDTSKSSQKSTESVVNVKTTVSLPSTTTQKSNSINTEINVSADVNIKPSKNSTDKIVITEDKDKENKLPTILDTALCENAVDGGNARLELAEEFLAASPTAAFLMSFPLVSGNRADSPAEEPQNAIQVNTKDNNNQRRNDVAAQPIPYFEKPNDDKEKSSAKLNISSNNILSKQTEGHIKYVENNVVSKQTNTKNSSTTATIHMTNDNPFLNLTMPSLIPTTGTLTDSTFGLDFDCNINKSIQSQPTSNFFYKSDPFSTVKSTIYSTSSISSGHEFNSFGLYPCAMEKYTSKNKSDFPNVEDNLMKIGSSRLTYDIDLGWSHKSLDFVNCTTTPNTFNKDNILTTATGPYSTSYNPFNPEFHVPLVSNSNKKDNTLSKPSSSYADTITSFYSQPTNLWSEDVPFYTNNNNMTKPLTTKHQNYLPLEHVQTNIKPNNSKQYETKQAAEVGDVNVIKTTNVGGGQQITDKYTKKSPNKMHINWMTSESRPMHSNCNPTHAGLLKETHKPTYGQLSHIPKKQDQNEPNYFPMSMHNFTTQATQEELQVWPSARPAGTTEISIEPPPINLPTLIGDLALGPHDKKRNTELANRGIPQSEIQNCSNFFSVTQLMNRSTDNSVPSRYHGANIEAPKSLQAKQNITHAAHDTNRKSMSRIESHLPQPCYTFNDTKSINSYEIMGQFSQPKSKANKSADKTPKVQKNNYSAESLIRGGTCTQKLQDNNNARFVTPTQKYNDFNAPQNSVAQVSHFPPILDYSDNSFTGQQFSGTTLYNSTTNTISNSFYSNFMPGSSNLMSGNYTSGPFSGDFMDYNQTPECNYTNHKYEDLKMRNNSAMFQQDKVPSNYKSSRRESAVKHKLECSKKESSKKYPSKRAKLNTEIEEWSDASHLLWQNKTPTKKHSNLMSEELPSAFPNYVGNQMPPSQYQPDFFNSHLMSSNTQSVGHNVDRSLTSFPVTSRANFNLSTIFPEITMKVQ